MPGGRGDRAPASPTWTDAMQSSEEVGIYAKPQPLFTKFTKLQTSIAKPLEGYFLVFFANMSMQNLFAKPLKSIWFCIIWIVIKILITWPPIYPIQGDGRWAHNQHGYIQTLARLLDRMQQQTLAASRSARSMPPPPRSLPEELVEEILLRFPPNDPARLVHAALVCKPWRAIVSGAGFRRRFREFHRTPPLAARLRLQHPHPRREQGGRVRPHLLFARVQSPQPLEGARRRRTPRPHPPPDYLRSCCSSLSQ